MNQVQPSVIITSDIPTPSSCPENGLYPEGVEFVSPNVNDLSTRAAPHSGRLHTCVEIVGVSNSSSFDKAEDECLHGRRLPMGSFTEELSSENASTTVSNGSDGERKCSILSFSKALLRNLVRTIGTSMLPVIIILACLPWFKFLAREAFLALVINAFVIPLTEIITVCKFFKDPRPFVLRRLAMFISFPTIFYLAWDLPLWSIFLITEGIQMTNNMFENHFALFPDPTLCGTRRFGSSFAKVLAYRVQLCFFPLMAFATFYINLNAAGISDTIQVLVTGIAFPVLKMFIIFQTLAYISNVMGEEQVPWPWMEIALEAGLDYPFKLCVISHYPFGLTFVTTVILNFISRVMGRLFVVSVVRYSEKPGKEKRLTRHFNDQTLKYTVTFTEAGDCVGTICAVASAFVIIPEDISMSLIYKALVILLAELGCQFAARVEESLNGQLVPDYLLWVGTMPGLIVIRMFAMYLIFRYALLV